MGPPYYGIEVKMDPNAYIESVQAQYNRATATFSLLSGEMIDYDQEFPEKEAAYDVKAWILYHKDELLRNFRTAKKQNTHPTRVSPLEL